MARKELKRRKECKKEGKSGRMKRDAQGASKEGKISDAAHLGSQLSAFNFWGKVKRS